MKLTEEDYKKSAKLIGCEIATIKAVSEVESNGGGFDAKGRVKMLFEPHIFWKQLKELGLTPERLIQQYPTILSPVWNKEMYGKTVDDRWNQLDLACKIHKESAYNSCSWGMFQIMGFNAKRAGFKNVFHMVDEFEIGEGKHLEGFVKYIKFTLLDDELKAKDWAGFARQYNGKLYYKNEYDKKLEKAYLKYSKA
jgi:N-acetylmuramidase